MPKRRPKPEQASVQAFKPDKVELSKPVPKGMPRHVRASIAASGELASERLHELLASQAFGKLRVSDQVAVMSLAFNRAYGMPESTNKSLSLNLSSDNADAVGSAMRKLALADLPERRTAQDVGGQDGSKPDFIDHHSQKSPDEL